VMSGIGRKQGVRNGHKCLSANLTYRIVHM
jgi:hypothetical protein